MKALITGSNGFVGRHLTAELRKNEYVVFGMDLITGNDVACVNTACVDILDTQAVHEHIQKINPDVVFHLAAQADVGLSWKKPQRTFEINVIGTINLLDAVRQLTKPCRIILIGSADEYGATGLPEEPISEMTALKPQNPYAVSKKTGEDIAKIYIKAYNMDIVLTRSFNHSGPGQGLGFLIPDLSNEIVKVERGQADHLKVGNLEAIRDFSDVRDIVRAYRLLAERGQSGEVYNVGSGIGRKAQDILDMLLGMSEREIPVRQDESRMRKSDTPVLVCDNTKLREHTGWAPKVQIEQTLADTIAFYRTL